MTCSEDQFEQEVKVFLEKSRVLHDSWSVYPVDSRLNSSPILQKSFIRDIDGVVYNFTYYIHFDEAYSCPIMSLKVFGIDDGKRIRLDELWRVLKLNSIPRDELFRMITEVQHPVLQFPVFQFHACATKEFMSGVMEGNCSYLVSWLSCVGSLCGLEVDLQYGL